MRPPFLLFLGDAPDNSWAKTAAGLAQWRPEACIGQHRLEGCGADVGLPELSFEEAAARGARTLVIGVANVGGFIAPSWVEALLSALAAGLDLAAGLHQRLRDYPEIVAAAKAAGRTLTDLRQPLQAFATGTGRKRSGRRLLTVGTDCAVGKKYTALAIERELKRRGRAASFCPTGQTGIMITGRGVAVDAVVADFIAGAAEWLSPDAAEDHWHVIEGQGALLHPAYAGVTLGLVHGSQPDALVVCHEAGRDRLQGHEADYPCPPPAEALAVHLAAARLTNPQVLGVGVSLNTARLDEAAARDALKRAEDDVGLPACDPVRWGVAAIVDRIDGQFGRGDAGSVAGGMSPEAKR